MPEAIDRHILTSVERPHTLPRLGIRLCALATRRQAKLMPYPSIATDVLKPFDVQANLFLECRARRLGRVIIIDTRSVKRPTNVRALRLAHSLQWISAVQADLGC
eukprot:scaffold5868_cov120-Isochrysis_galbana.AAC.15